MLWIANWGGSICIMYMHFEAYVVPMIELNKNNIRISMYAIFVYNEK